MHPSIKKAVLGLLPPLRRIVTQRDQLFAITLATRSDWRKHRPYALLSAEPAIGTGSSVDDKRMVERLVKAYQRSSSDQYGSGSMWRDFFDSHHKDPHETFMRGDVAAARQILANPGTNFIFKGFDELCLDFAQRPREIAQDVANGCQDNLIRLAEAMGVLRFECPEHGLWLTKDETETNKILHMIESELDADISFPDIYRDSIGIRSYRGIVTYRAVQALYLAYRLSKIVNVSAPRDTPYSICEIGAGLGRSALFANQLGLKDYTLVDVPMTTISQGYYLMRCLGEDAVVLPGEPRRSHEQIRLMHSEDFFSSKERFDLIVAVDCLTEFGPALASQYVRKIPEIAPAFLSVNHEANSVRVFDLLREPNVPYRISRYPYWMRQGYVEEFVSFQS